MALISVNIGPQHTVLGEGVLDYEAVVEAERRQTVVELNADGLGSSDVPEDVKVAVTVGGAIAVGAKRGVREVVYVPW